MSEIFLSPWLHGAFAESGRLRPPVEQLLIEAAARIIEEKCECGPYWAGAVAEHVFQAMSQAFSKAS